MGWWVEDALQIVAAGAARSGWGAQLRAYRDGNYNATTARIYTDLSLFTANPEITRAVHDVFSFLTAYAENPSYEPLLGAPLDLAEKTIALIDREAEHARQGRPDGSSPK